MDIAVFNKREITEREKNPFSSIIFAKVILRSHFNDIIKILERKTEMFTILFVSR